MRPDGHFKFLYLWPVKFLQARQVNCQSFVRLVPGPFAVFNRHMRELQGQTERVTVQTTLGALCTALVLDCLHHTVVGECGHEICWAVGRVA